MQKTRTSNAYATRAITRLIGARSRRDYSTGRATRRSGGIAFHVSFAGLIVLFSTVLSAFSQQPSPSARVPTVHDAAAALAAGDLQQAETDLSAVLSLTPNDVHALNLLGVVRAQQKREAEAESLFEKAIAVQPGFAGAHASLGLLYVQMGKDDLAIPRLQEALRLDPARSDAQAVLIGVWRRHAHAAIEERDPEKALSLLIGARKLNPNDADLQYDLGMVALHMSLLPDAVEAFQQTLKLRPEDAAALYGLGRSKMEMARFEEAQQAFQHYVELRPADASGHYALGITLQALQRPSDARAEYEKSIVLHPQQTESYVQLGLIDLDAGNTSAAASKFERVLRRVPQHAGALSGLGRVQFQEKQYAEAAASLKNAIAADRDSREAHYYLGLTDARLGKKEESEKELQTASRLEHEEVEKHQNMLKILDPEELQGAGTAPAQ